MTENTNKNQIHYDHRPENEPYDYGQDLEHCAKTKESGEDGLHNWKLSSDSLTFFCTSCNMRPPPEDSPKIIPYAHRCESHHSLSQLYDGTIVSGYALPLWGLKLRQLGAEGW